MSLSSLRFSATLITFHRHSLKSPNSFFSLPTTHFRAPIAKPNLLVPTTRASRLAVARRNEPSGFNFDSILSIAELACLLSSAVLTIRFAASGLKNEVLGVWGLVVMVGGVLVGALIRRRQWSRVCMESVKGGVEGFYLVDKIERLERDVKTSTDIILGLSRQLEKLGTRFRVTRRSMKDPIAETAALAQKNYEATRALAAQKDNLEKELCEVHNILLIMQEQQHKQLELIIAIGKAGNLFNDEEVPEQEHDTKEKPQSDEGVNQIDTVKKLEPDEVLKKTETSPLHQAIGKARTQS